MKNGLDDLKEKEKYENFKNEVLEEYKKGNIVFMTIEGPTIAPLVEFLKQPAEGILYDLNRDRLTVLTYINEEKWVNDFAVSVVIEVLKKSLDEAEEKIKELEKKGKCKCNESIFEEDKNEFRIN